MRLRFKDCAFVTLLVVTCALLWSAYAPEQWLQQIRRFVRSTADEPRTSLKPQLPEERIEGRGPKEVVDEIWRMATQGQFLTPQGWHFASGFFTEPTPFPEKGKIVVVSNDWGPAYEVRSDGSSKVVAVGYEDAGSVDAKLRYTPPAKTDAIKTAVAYTLITVPSYLMMYGPDGKTLVEKRPTGSVVWVIKGSQGSPVTTVNTAIRYILEMRQKTTDRAIKENANETLAQLLKLH